MNAEYCLVHGNTLHYDRRSGFDICYECERENQIRKQIGGKPVRKTTFEKKSLSEVKVGSDGMFGYSTAINGHDGIEVIITAKSMSDLELHWHNHFAADLDLSMVKQTITFEVQL